MPKKRKFGIGSSLQDALASTVQAATSGAGELHIEMISLNKIELDPENPRDLVLNSSDLNSDISEQDTDYERKRKEKAELKSLAASIDEQGVINPIIVYQHGDYYRLVAGERRTLASLLNHCQTIPAKILPERPEPLKLSLLQWVENMEREDLTLWERLRNLDKIAAAFARSKGKQIGEVSATELAELLHCSIQQSTNYKAILTASATLKTHIEKGEISNIEKAALIAKANTSVQPDLITACLSGATLKQLKSLADTKVKKKKPAKKKAAQINFGATAKPKVAKILIESVLAHPEFSTVQKEIGEIKWDNPTQINQAFKRLIKSLEKAAKED